MSVRNVVLTGRQETLIEALVQSGRYENASEVLREGLRLIENREREEAAKLEALRAAVDAGIAAAERGDAKSFSSVAQMIEHLKAVGAEVRAASSAPRA